MTALDAAGFHGPYMLGLSPRRYNLLFRRYETGGTDLEHLSQMVRSIVKLPALEDGGVLIAEGRQYAAIVDRPGSLTVDFVGPTVDAPGVLASRRASPSSSGSRGRSGSSAENPPPFFPSSRGFETF